GAEVSPAEDSARVEGDRDGWPAGDLVAAPPRQDGAVDPVLSVADMPVSEHSDHLGWGQRGVGGAGGRQRERPFGGERGAGRGVLWAGWFVPAGPQAGVAMVGDEVHGGDPDDSWVEAADDAGGGPRRPVEVSGHRLHRV